MTFIVQKRIVVPPYARTAALGTEYNIDIHKTVIAENTSIDSHVCYIIFNEVTACKDIINARLLAGV